MSSTILDQIGDTPLVRLSRCVPSNGAEVWLKLELQNPTGSMKDRMAVAMIEGAERDGLIGPETTIVEYSGGSTGIMAILSITFREPGKQPYTVQHRIKLVRRH